MGKGGSSKGGNGKAGAQKTVPNMASRKFVSKERTMGVVDEWKGTWGWLVPLQKVNHAFAEKNRGRVYVHKNDVRGGDSLSVGAHVDFLVYADGKGLGGSDCRDIGASAGQDSPPAGWETIWSDEHSQNYYWHKATKTASWTMPGAEEDNEDGDDAEAEERHKGSKISSTHGTAHSDQEAEKALRPAASGPALGQQRIQGTVAKWQGFFGWISPLEAVNESLRPLLEKNQDKFYVNWRDVQKGLKMEEGLLVSFTVYSDDSGLGAKDVRSAKGQTQRADASQAALEQLEEEWAEQDVELGLADGDAAEEAAAAEPADDARYEDDAADGRLLPGWEQQWSDEHNCHYYWHAATKVSSWDRPAVPGSSGGAAASKDKVWEGEGSVQGASKMATPITPFASKVGREITPITPGAASGNAAVTPRGKGKGKGKAAVPSSRPAPSIQQRPAKLQRF